MHKLSQTQRRNEERRNPPEEDPEFQIAPMIDILLVLLVFFMSISSTEVLQSNRAIQLPVANDAKSATKNPGQVIINVTWVALNNVGALEINDRAYPDASAIVPVLQQAIAANPLVRVLIRADKAVRYEFMRTIMKSVGDAGVSNVTFSVVDKEAAQ